MYVYICTPFKLYCNTLYIHTYICIIHAEIHICRRPLPHRNSKVPGSGSESALQKHHHAGHRRLPGRSMGVMAIRTDIFGGYVPAGKLT